MKQHWMGYAFALCIGFIGGYWIIVKCTVEYTNSTGAR